MDVVGRFSVRRLDSDGFDTWDMFEPSVSHLLLAWATILVSGPGAAFLLVLDAPTLCVCLRLGRLAFRRAPTRSYSRLLPDVRPVRGLNRNYIVWFRVVEVGVRPRYDVFERFWIRHTGLHRP